MTSAGPQDGGSNPTHLKDKLEDKIKHPFSGLREKLKDTKLHDMKVSLIHKKYVRCPLKPCASFQNWTDNLRRRHEIGKLANLVNPNHRHDEEHEKITDDKRTKVSESHRFQSFAPERPGNNIKWYVDGRDYFFVSLLIPKQNLGSVSDET